jgi:WD40 repeat protein
MSNHAHRRNRARSLKVSRSIPTLGNLVIASSVFLLAFPDLPGTAGEGKSAPPRTDLFGDPLPEGALARLGTLRWRQHRVYCAAFSPDGKLLARGGDDAIPVWEVATGKALHVLRGHSHPVNAVAFSPDGRLLASRSDDGTLRVWEVATERQLLKLPSDGNPGGLAFSADGRMLAAPQIIPSAEGRRDGSSTTIRIWDIATGRETLQIRATSIVILAVCFSPDGTILATAGLPGHDLSDDNNAQRGLKPSREKRDSTGAVQLWDTATGKEVRFLGRDRAGFSSVTFAPDGKLVAAGGDHTAVLWETVSGKEIHRLPAGASGGRSLEELRQLGRQVRVVFGPGGTTLLSACEDRTVCVWDVDSGAKLRQLPDQFHPVSLAASPNGALLSVGHQLWDLPSGKKLQPAAGHEGLVSSVSFTPDGKAIVSAIENVRVWDPNTGKELRRMEGFALAVVSPDGKLVACGDRHYAIYVRDFATGQELRRFRAHYATFTHSRTAAFSPDSKLLAAESEERISVWELDTGKEIPWLPQGRTDQAQVNAIAFAPDGSCIAWAPSHSDARLQYRGQNAKSYQFDQINVKALAFSPDGQFLALAGGNPLRPQQARRSLRLWEVATGKEIAPFIGVPKDISGVVFSPDGRTMATWHIDGTSADGVRLWEFATGKERYRFTGHQGAIRCVAFSPKGRTLVTGSDDNTLLVWDVVGVGDRRTKPMEKLWQELGDDDAKQAYLAMRQLGAAGARSAAYLGERLGPLAQPDERIAKLIDNLDSPAFATRIAAMEKLEKFGRDAVPALRFALRQTGTLELRRRLEQLLHKLDGQSPNLAESRIRRAIEVLDYLNVPEADRVLEKLGKGPSVSWPTAEARAALDRAKAHGKN